MWYSGRSLSIGILPCEFSAYTDQAIPNIQGNIQKTDEEDREEQGYYSHCKEICSSNIQHAFKESAFC